MYKYFRAQQDLVLPSFIAILESNILLDSLDFGRAHYEVEQMKKWFNPIMDLKY